MKTASIITPPLNLSIEVLRNFFSWIALRRASAVWSLFVLFFAVCLLSGCAFWNNFSTYFNTLYLARTHVEAYEQSLAQPATISSNSAVAVQSHRWLDEEFLTREMAQREGRTIAVLPTFSRSLSAGKPIVNVHLDSAIILGSKILASKKPTKYIEDALFIIGKAQYYKNDFGGARRKFLELFTKYPDTHYAAEASVLLARSMVASRIVDSAAAILTIGQKQAEAAHNKEQLGELHRARAEYIYARNPDSLAAIADELRAAEDGLSGTELSRLTFEEGAIDFFNGNWPGAEHAFSLSADAAKDDWSEGEARIAHALTLRHEGKYAEAESELKLVGTRTKYVSSQAAARYELAYTQDLEARSKVSGNLRNPDFHRLYSSQLVQNYYALDTTYRNSSIAILSREKFRTAELYREMGEYDSASKYTANLVGTKDFSSSAMNDLVSNRMRALSKFSYWRNEIAKSDSLEGVARGLRHPENGRNEDAAIHLQAMQEALGAKFRPEVPVKLTGEDSLRISQIEAKLHREALLHPKLVASDTARFIDSVEYRAASAHFELGHAYEAFSESQSARSEYHVVTGYHYHVSDTAKTALHAQALYALLQLESHEHQQLAADSALHELLGSYGQTIYAEQAREIFGTNDPNSRGEIAYRGAYQSLKANGVQSAKPLLLDVVGSYPHEDVAPRALYAIGLTFEEASSYDSAVSYYREILRNYPFSQYASAIRPRLADASVAPQSVGRVDPMDSRTNDQKQEEEVIKARKQREERMRLEMQSNPPGLPPLDQQPGREGGVPLGRDRSMPPGAGPLKMRGRMPSPPPLDSAGAKK